MLSFHLLAESCVKIKISQSSVIRFTNLATLPGEYCQQPVVSNVTELYMYDVPFTTMPVCLPDSISLLSLQNDEISSIENNKTLQCLNDSLPDSLRTFSLKYTAIPTLKSLFCRPTPSLRSVWVSYCRVDHFEFGFSWSPTVETIFFDYCGLKQTHFTDFGNATKLRDLRLRGNRLSNIPENLPCSLQVLDLKRNNITSVDVSTWRCMIALEEMTLSYNKLTSFPMRMPSSLQILDLSNNMIEYLPSQAFKPYVNLTRLMLSDNM